MSNKEKQIMNRIEKIRKEKKISIQQLSNAAEITQVNYFQKSKNPGLWKLRELLKIEKFLGENIFGRN